MKPFQKYTFQRSKNVFENEHESVEKWVKPTLNSGATLRLMPLIKGERAALHKRGVDFYLQIEDSDENLIKNYQDITEDFKEHDTDFIIEGVIDKNVFHMSDILYYGEDLINKVYYDRREVLVKNFISGYNSVVTLSYIVETLDQFKNFTNEHKDGFHAAIDQSLYNEGCPSNQWCSVGKGLSPKKTIEKSKIDSSLVDWSENIQKGVSGEFTVLKNGDIYQCVLHPIRPIKTNSSVSINFETVDKGSALKRQFDKGNQFLVGFSKTRSSQPHENIVDSGTFNILTSTSESTSIDLNGKNIFKGIFHVDGISKHNFKDAPDVPTDLVYQLSYSDANIEVEKRFGQLTWWNEDKDIQKGIAPIVKNQDEERFVFGEVLVPNEIDAHGDIYSADEVRFAAHFFMEKFGNIGLMHEKFINDDAKIIETFVAPVSMTIEGRKVKKGTWLIGMRILKDSLFEDVKAGRLTGFSIGGIATVQELRKLMCAYGYVVAT